MSTIARKPAELFVDPAVILEARPDGTRLFRSALELPGYARCSGEWLERWAAETPDAILIAERGADGEWVKVTYGQALARVYRIATWLLGQNLSPERPVLVLSDNGIEHALLMLACLHVGVPISPVSPGNSLLSSTPDEIDGARRSLGDLVLIGRPGRALDYRFDLQAAFPESGGDCHARRVDVSPQLHAQNLVVQRYSRARFRSRRQTASLRGGRSRARRFKVRRAGRSSGDKTQMGAENLLSK